jgi:formyl-CoA transferase/CoA:oxalate CoA-transferase
MNGPLEGVRVLDLSRVLAGPLAGGILADLGAEVIKVERPDVGDDLRYWGPPFADNGVSTYFVTVNRNKHGIALDLKDPASVQLVKELAADSDVVIENFKVGEAEKLGMGYAALSEGNPGLIYCSISGFGQVGPWARLPGYDVLMQALSGLMAVTGEPDGEPMRSGVAVVDICTAQFAAIGIVAALAARQSTGRGQRVDVSLLETALAIQPNMSAGFLVAGDQPRRHGNGHPNVTPYGAFPTADGHIVLAVGNDDQWRRLCTAFGSAAADYADQYATNQLRMQNRQRVEAAVRSWTTQMETAELIALLTKKGVPHAPVNTIAQALRLDQVRAVGAIGQYPIDDHTDVELVNLPIHFSGGQRSTRVPPPAVAETPDAETLKSLGVSAESIERYLSSRESGK